MTTIPESTRQHFPVGQIIKDLKREISDYQRENMRLRMMWRNERVERKKLIEQLKLAKEEIEQLKEVLREF